jgi:hypothetical protein
VKKGLSLDKTNTTKSVPTPIKARHVSTTQTMLFREIIDVYWENNTKYTKSVGRMFTSSGKVKKVKLSLYQAMKAHRVVRR